MKTAELTGALLDYWAAKATRGDTETLRDFEFWKQEVWECGQDRFSADWAQGGPIIDKLDIQIGGYGASRQAEIRDDSQLWINQWGETTLIAAMRAAVAYKFGDEVPEANQ